MERSHSPSSSQSTVSSAHEHISTSSGRINGSKRPSYSLFPAVQTPSPLLITPSPQHKTLASTPEKRRTRSSSLDGTTTLAVVRQSIAAYKPSLKSSKGSGTPKKKDLPVVQPKHAHSATASSDFGFFPNFRRSIYSSHSSSASVSSTEELSALPPRFAEPPSSESKPAWMSKQATHHPCVTGHGLGLSLFPPDPESPTEQQPPMQRRLKPKPNLTIQVMNTYEEKPPPPPPKSPRYSSNSSIQSSLSSTRETSPASSAPTSPDSVTRSAILYMQSSAMHTSGEDVRGCRPCSAKPSAGPLRSGPTQSFSQRREERTLRPRIININKPMPSLPLPSSRFSPYVCQSRVVEGNGERTPKAISPAIDSCHLTYTDAASAYHALNSEAAEGMQDGPSPPPALSVAAALRRASSQSAVVQQDVIMISPTQPLKELAEQIEAMYERYATLRSERLKLSSAISSSLREHKPAPDCAGALLDQVVELNAINSSMDVCFARLKALDCKREEMITALIAQCKQDSENTNAAPAGINEINGGDVNDKRQTVIHAVSPLASSHFPTRSEAFSPVSPLEKPAPPPSRKPPSPPIKHSPADSASSRPSRSNTELSFDEIEIETPKDSDAEWLDVGKMWSIPSIEILFEDRVVHYCDTPSPQW